MADNLYNKGKDIYGNGIDFWGRQADKIQINPQYEDMKALTNKKTAIPYAVNQLGSNATNFIVAMATGGASVMGAKALGVNGAKTLGAIGTIGSTAPTFALEGEYKEKINNFIAMNGREPNAEELKKIQNVTLGEKSVNTALEIIPEKLLFGKLFPQGTVQKGLKQIGKSFVEQALTEGATEALQETSSITAEKLLGQNQDDFLTNLYRVGNSAVSGGIVGGISGGGATLASRPFDTLNNEKLNNAVQAVKDVSAQVMSNGKELYNSAKDKYQNANKSAFDVMMENSREREKYTQLAPNIAKKQENKQQEVEQKQEAQQPKQETQEETRPVVQNYPAVVEDYSNIAPNVARKRNNRQVAETPDVIELPDTQKQQQTEVQTSTPTLTGQVEQNVKAEEVQNNQNSEVKSIKHKDRDNGYVNTTGKPDDKGHYSNFYYEKQKSKGDTKKLKETQKDYYNLSKHILGNILSSAKIPVNNITLGQLANGKLADKVDGYIEEGFEAWDKGELINYGFGDSDFYGKWDKYKMYEWALETYASKGKWEDGREVDEDGFIKSPKNLSDYQKNIENNVKVITGTSGIPFTFSELMNNDFKTTDDIDNYLQNKINENTSEKEIEKIFNFISDNYSQYLLDNKIEYNNAILDEENEKAKNNGQTTRTRDNNSNSNKEISVSETNTLNGESGSNDNAERKQNNGTSTNEIKQNKGKVQQTETPSIKTAKKNAPNIAKKQEEAQPTAKEVISNFTNAVNTNLNEEQLKKVEEIFNKNREQAPNIVAKNEAKIKEQEKQKQIEEATKLYEDNIFIPNEQKQVLIDDLQGSESEYFIKEAKRLHGLIENAPKMYETDGIDLLEKKPVLHYFGGSYDNYVFEIDKENGEMFSLVSYQGGDLDNFEMGYSSIDEIVDNELINLDMYYDNTQTIGDIFNKNGNNIKEETQEEVKDNGQGNDETIRRGDGKLSDELASSDNGNGRGLHRNEEENKTSTEERGTILEEHKALIDKKYKNQHELNIAIEEFINNKEYEKYSELPAEIKDWLKKFAGAGGLEKQGATGKGLLSEYYTPKNIVNKMWELTAQYIDTNGAKVLEPSVGIGRFLENAPENTTFNAFEINPVSAKITELLYPNATVNNNFFQEQFIKDGKPIKNVTPEYDIVIGNPPYGEYRGRYKGLGEGKNHKQLESYFIDRGLDTLKENGIMTVIVPSSFLKNNDNKLGIANKGELLDAYRLPNNTFDTTSIGTDILVFRKKGKNKASDTNIYSDKWFKEHPEKILGEVQEGKGNWGTDIVKGDKNAVDNIKTDKKDIKETVTTENKQTKNNSKNKTNQTKKQEVVQKGNVEYEEYKAKKVVSEEDRQYFEDTQVDGTLPKDKYEAGEKVNQYNGELYNDFNYLQGNIYEKLEQLENENLPKEQKDRQRKKLESVLPKARTVHQIEFNPTSEFMLKHNIPVTTYDDYAKTETTKDKPIMVPFKEYISKLSSKERDNIPVDSLNKYLEGKADLGIGVTVPKEIYLQGEKAVDKYKNRKNTENKIKAKNIAEKLFNEYIRNELSKEQQERLADLWNREFNNNYLPDYKEMPLLVKGLNSKFNGKDLRLYDVQVEGINFMTNKGVGLAGFEVGVGKTLTGIVATVQNMQMGRCKRPFVLVPAQTKDNWIREINELFPNIKVNDAGNLTEFDGKIEDGTITVATHEALNSLWYNKSTEELTSMFERASKNYNKEAGTKRSQEAEEGKYSQMVGVAEKGNKKLFNAEDLGIDHILVDEAHNFKNLFKQALAQKELGRNQNFYSNISGSESDRAKRMFLLAQYILDNNDNRNVFMLTATPFNNSPLEIYNMLSYLAKDSLDKAGLNNVYQFMEHYADITTDWVLNYKNEVEYKTIVKGFKNVASLRELIKNSMIIRSADDAGIVRPNKHNESPKLEPTQRQLDMMADAEELATNGKKDEGAVLQAIGQLRMITISPDIADKNYSVSPEEFIKNAPKLDYIVKAVEAMKNKDPKTSQLIYMPIGVEFLPKIKQYLVNKGTYKSDEIQIVDSKVKKDKLIDITDSFNDPEGKIKLIIGTEVIREGMNLNKNSSVLYIPFLDWNPTDYLQTVGRIWRQGNKYDDIRVITPILKNSSDSFMVQKLETKSGRINAIMDEEKDYIELSDIMTPEDKINMITLPEKKLKMFLSIEKQKLEDKVLDVTARKEQVTFLKNKLRDINKNISEHQELLDYYLEKQKELTEDSPSWTKNNINGKVKDYTNHLKQDKKELESLEKRIKNNEIEFEGKDSEVQLDAQIGDIKAQIENLEKIGEEKLKEYQAQYEEEQKNSKSIEEHIKDFDTQTDELYKGKVYNQEKIEQKDNEVIDLPKEVQELVDLGLEKISKVTGVSIDELKSNNNPTIKDYTNNEELSQNKPLGNYSDYKNGNIITLYKGAGRNTAVHEFAHWYLETMSMYEKGNRELHDDIEAVRKFLGNNGESFTETQHEKFARGFEAYLRNGKAETNRLRRFFEKFKKSLKAIYSSIKNIIYKDGNNVMGFTQKDIANINKVYNRLFSTEAEREEQKALDKEERAKKKEDKIKSRREKAEEVEDATEANKKAKQYILKWYGEIENKRYDVNKRLNNLVNITKNISKELKSKGIKASDKQLREIMPFLRERTEVPEKLDREDLKKIYRQLSIEDKDRLTKLADDTSNLFEQYYKDYLNAKGEVSEVEIKNHISHIWDLDKKQNKMLTNYFATNSRFAKQRTIETLAKGINGIEVDGETVYLKPKELDYAKILKTSSDTLIKATADVKLAEKVKGIQLNGVNLVMKRNEAPSDWVEFDHPALNKAVFYKSPKTELATISKKPIKVHPDIARTLNTVFETPTDISGGLAFYDKLGSIVKQSELGFSAFHMLALTESAIGNLGIRGTLKVLSPARVWDEVVKGNWSIYKEDSVAKQAMNDGLQIGSTLDLNQDTIEQIINDTSSWISKHTNMPILGKMFRQLDKANKGVKFLQEANSKVLWDYLHNNYKLDTYTLICDNEAKRLGRNLKAEERQEVAQWVNDSFGGQVWELLGVSSRQRRLEQRLLLSPDWLRSTTRQFLGMLATGKGTKFINEQAKKSEGWKKTKQHLDELGITSDSEIGSSLRGRVARKFWLSSIIFASIFYNVINALMRKWDEEKHPELYLGKMSLLDYTLLGNAPDKKLNLFVGRNSDGSERYINILKQFKEFPELISKPLERLGGKANPLIHFTSTALTGHTAGGFKNKDMFEAGYNGQIKKGWDRIGAAAIVGAKSLLPYSLNDAFNPDKDFSSLSFVSSVSKGMTKGKTKSEFEKAYKKHADKKEFKKIARQAYRNNISEKDIESAMKSARNTIAQPYTDKIVKLVLDKDKKGVKEVIKKMKKDGYSEDIIELAIKKAEKKLKEEGKELKEKQGNKL